MDNGRTALIIGAGPAGLTAAYYLLKETDIKPIILEESEYIGGISRTAKYNGNRIDIIILWKWYEAFICNRNIKCYYI